MEEQALRKATEILIKNYGKVHVPSTLKSSQGFDDSGVCPNLYEKLRDKYLRGGKKVDQTKKETKLDLYEALRDKYLRNK